MDYLTKLLNAKLKPSHCAADVGDEWRTPDLEFYGIQEKFGFGKFSIDLFTDGEINSKCDHFFTAKDNALTQDWGKYCRDHYLPLVGYANPPFSKPHVGKLDNGETCTGLASCMKKAYAEMRLGFYSVWFVPNNPEADWFPHENSKYPASDIYWVTNGRISFDVPIWYKQDPNGSKPSSSRGGMCIIVFDPVVHTGKPFLNTITRQELRELGANYLADLESTKNTKKDAA